MRSRHCLVSVILSFKLACDLFGGDTAVETDEVPLKYIIYDMAAEYWHIPNVEEILSTMDKKQLMYWLGYREIRMRLEKKKQQEASKGVKN